MGLLARAFARPGRYERAQRFGRWLSRPLTREGWISRRLPGALGRWTDVRDLPAPSAETFREWWAQRR